GHITTVAGNAVAGPGYNEGGTAKSAKAAQLRFPRGVAVDSAGNLFIADEGNCVIRKVAADQSKSLTDTITTVIGKAGVCSASTTTSTAEVTLNHPYDVAVSGSGDIYIADT